MVLPTAIDVDPVIRRPKKVALFYPVQGFRVEPFYPPG
jgi:hypothetical protein